MYKVARLETDDQKQTIEVVYNIRKIKVSSAVLQQNFLKSLIY